MKENTTATNFGPHECVIFLQSTKIGTHENKAIHSTIYKVMIYKHCVLHKRLYSIFLCLFKSIKSVQSF